MNKISILFVILLALSGLIILNGCSKVRESAGVNRKVPDEYTISPSEPLELPPEYNLLPSDEIVSKKESENDDSITREILFGLDEDDDSEKNQLNSSSVVDSILENSGANTTPNNIREEVELLNKKLVLSSKGVFSGEKYMTEEEILDAVKESERIRNNIFNNKDLLEGDTPITTRPKKRESLINKLF